MGKLIRASINFISRPISAFFLPSSSPCANNPIKYEDSNHTGTQEPGEAAEPELQMLCWALLRSMDPPQYVAQQEGEGTREGED